MYTLEQFDRDMETVQPRAFDTYVLPAFLMFYAIRSKNAMGRWPRRILFTSGVYMLYRNWSQIKGLMSQIRERAGLLAEQSEETVDESQLTEVV